MLKLDALVAYILAALQTRFAAESIHPSPEMGALMAEFGSRAGCWRSIFPLAATWANASSAPELAATWQAVIQTCGEDGRAVVAFPFIDAVQTRSEILRTLWLALPFDAADALKVTLASNPLVYAMFSASPSPLTGLPASLALPAAADAVWEKFNLDVERLKRVGPGRPPA